MSNDCDDCESAAEHALHLRVHELECRLFESERRLGEVADELYELYHEQHTHEHLRATILGLSVSLKERGVENLRPIGHLCELHKLPVDAGGWCPKCDTEPHAAQSE